MRFFILMMLGVVLGGCVRSEGPQWAGALELPRGGAPLDEGAARVLASPGTLVAGEPVIQETVLWPLPMISRKYRVDLDGESGRPVVSDYSMVGLGVPLAYLPVQFSFSQYVYPAEGGEPVHSLKRRYWPWWSWAGTEGEAPEMEGLVSADLHGIPLLYEYGTEAGPAWFFSDTEQSLATHQEFRFWTALWWIGPVFFDQVLEFENDGGAPVREAATYFFPLFLGRAPGALLWTSSAVERREEGQVTTSRGHGPLLGYAGYHSSRVTEGPGEGSGRTMLLGGIPWWDSTRVDGETGERRRTIGPLWGMFGLLTFSAGE